MEPILENIELPSPNPQAPPDWNPANVPIPLEFYDNAPGPVDVDCALSSPFADFDLQGENGETVSPDNTTFELDLSDSEFQSFDDESDSCSVKSGGDQKRIAKGRNKVDKRREWGLQSPVSPTPPKRNSKHTETYQYHLISPIFKDRHHFVSKDHPRFKELEGKDPEFDECRYKYFIICVGSHFWKRTRNQVIRPARSGIRRQNSIQVRDRRMNVQTFYYSLTFELETMAPLKLRSYTDLIRAIKTQIPPQAPKLFSVSHTNFDSPLKFTVTSHQQQTTPGMRSNNLPEISCSKDFRSSKEVDPFAPGKFMDNLEELSQLDIPSTTTSGSKSGPVLVTAVQCAKVNSFGKISPIDYGESRVLQCDTDLNSLVSAAGGGGIFSTASESGNERSLQLTYNSSISKANSNSSSGQVTVDVSPKSTSTLHTTAHNTTVVGDSFRSSINKAPETFATPPPPPARTAASMNKSSDRYLSPVSFQTSESPSSIVAPMDPDALSKTWSSLEDPEFTAAWNKLNQVDLIENPPLIKNKEFFLVKPHKCAFTGLDGLCRCCHFSHAHRHEGHYKDLTVPVGNGGDVCGSTSSLDTLIGELWALSDQVTAGSDVNESDEDWSCVVQEVRVTERERPASSVRKKKRPSSPRLPENFVSDMDEILKKQIADLERETSVSPLPKSLSVTPTSELYQQSAERPATLALQKRNNSEDRSQSYDMDALGGDEGLEFAYLRHSPIDSDFDSSSISSYHSLSPTPMREKKKKKFMFKDENEAFEYFKVRHFEAPYVQPDVAKKEPEASRMEPPPTPPRGSSRSRTAMRMLGKETDALDFFQIKHYRGNGHDHDRDRDNECQHSVKTRQEYIDQLNKYTPRIQPAVPARGDSSLKFQQKLMELSRLSAACGEVADQIQHDHQEYWGALTEKYKVPDPREKSLVSEAYQRVPFVRTFDTTPKFPVPEVHASNVGQESDPKKTVQTDLKNTRQISSAVGDNIVNIASSVRQAQPTGMSSSSPRTMRNEIRINVTPTPEIPDTASPRISSPVPGHGTGPGLWYTSSAREVSRVNQDSHNNKRSVTWCDDLTSTDDDRMSDSSASVTPDRKLEPASSSSLKSIQKMHSQKRKKKKVSWSDDYNTDDDRHSSSTSLSSSVCEPNSPDPARHLPHALPGFGSTISPLVNVQPNVGIPVLPPQAFPRKATRPSSEISQQQQKPCPVYGQPIFATAGTDSNSSSPQINQGSSGNLMAQSTQPSPPGLAKTSLGVQRFRVENSRVPVKSGAPPKIPPFPLDLNQA